MTKKTSVEQVNSNQTEAVASPANNVRPEPSSLRVRTAVKSGADFVFTSKITKSSPG